MSTPETVTAKICDLTHTQRPNENSETGIHYGFTYLNHLNEFVFDTFFYDGEDLSYKYAVENVKKEINQFLENIYITPTTEIVDSIWEGIEQEWNDHYESEGSEYSYEGNGYKLLLQPDGDVIVIESKYYALRGQCSPCAPNGGHLETEGNMKTYCLSPDWYEDNEAPFDIFEVLTGEVVWGEGDKEE